MVEQEGWKEDEPGWVLNSPKMVASSSKLGGLHATSNVCVTPAVA